MKALVLFVGWCILFVLCWPLAVFALILFPLVWLLSLPLRLVGITMEAVFALLRALLFLPARLLGWRRRERQAVWSYSHYICFRLVSRIKPVAAVAMDAARRRWEFRRRRQHALGENTANILVVLGELIELVVRIWHADSEIRDRSLLGESELEKRSRRSVAWLCGGTITLLILAGVAWWWFARQRWDRCRRTPDSFGAPHAPHASLWFDTQPRALA